MFYALKTKKYIISTFQNANQSVKNKEGWYYLTLTKLSKLLKRITSKYNGDFYCLNCFDSFRTNVSEHKEFCNIKMPSKENKLFKFTQCLKSFEEPTLIYADLHSHL